MPPRPASQSEAIATSGEPAAGTDRPLPHHIVLEREYVHLHGALPDGHPTGTTDSQARTRAIVAALHARGHSALCLSGGGIRSASFAVGVLQGLASRGLLTTFDFLSTVSGGGYTGGWLSAWLFHAQHDGVSAEEVYRRLAGGPDADGAPEAAPLQQIREYSNYLDPKVGTFSVDVWTLVATLGRNLVLNWLVLVPLLAAALLIPRLYFAMTMLGTQDWIDRDDLLWWSWWLMVVGGGLLLIAMLFIARNLPSVGNQQRDQKAFLAWCFGPLCVATVLLTWYWAWSRALDADPVTARGLITLGAVGHLAIWMVAILISRRWRPMTALAAATSGALAGFGAWAFATGAFAKPLARGDVYASLAVPLILGILSLAGVLFVGIASSETTDDDREWWSRFGAWLLISIVLWLATSAVVFVGPWAVQRVISFANGALQSPGAGKALLGLVTALSGGIAVRTSRETKTAPTQTPLWRRVAFALAAPIFVVLLLVNLAAANLWALTWLNGAPIIPAYHHPIGGGLPEVVLLLLVLIVGGVLMGLVVPVNRFSLHGMYRDRLIRAFLGASRPAAERRPNLFTGFDQRDNIFLHELTVTKRPVHVINMALNLVADRRLAWQERKAESFTVSPLAAGSRTIGYRPVAAYGGPEGMSLGTAITISGAAASPNMGYHSSPAITFLLTLFNARLGAWLGNPGAAGHRTWRASDPRAGAAPLLREMFGRTTDANPYVYVSDGGHFENLGLYEMVARRCRFIVVSDAGCDADYAFEDLGNAIRKIRIDLGIPIEFPDGLGIDAGHVGQGNAHGAVGVIRYSAMDGSVPDGAVLYLKATLSGDEPVDVRNYASIHPDFPHETTANQWFGEAQYESYRMLGRHTLDTIAGTYDGRDGLAGLIAIMSERRHDPRPPA